MSEPLPVVRTPLSAPLPVVRTPCALCGAEASSAEATGHDFEYDTVPDEFGFVACANCGHIYLCPRPATHTLDLIYPDDYYAFSEGTGNPLVARLRRVWEAGKVRLYRELVGDGERRILDVGCGDGRFLGILRDHGPAEWDLVGIDFDAGAVASCRKRGFEAHAARVEDFEDQQGAFDAVIMLQLIEHVADPPLICRRVFELLRPGGHFIVETPNLAGLDYRLFRGRHWGHYHFPRHWNLFSTASLERMLTQAGFETARIDYLISTSSWIISIHNYLLDRGWPAGLVRFFHYQNPLLLGGFVLFDTLRARTGFETSNQRVIARKPV